MKEIGPVASAFPVESEPDSGTPAVAAYDQAYLRIRDALMDGAFSPGERLSIRRVAAALDTGVMPARTALQRLATERALDVLPSGTTVVPRLTRSAFLHLTEMRLQLEPLAVKFAAPRLKASHYKELNKFLGGHNAARERGDPDQAMKFDRAFLFTLYQLADSPMLFGFIESMWLRRSPIFWKARWALLGRGGTTVNRHKEILAALLESDVEAACADLRAEIKGAADFLLEQLTFADDAPRGKASIGRL